MNNPVNYEIAKLLTLTDFNQKSTNKGYVIDTKQLSFDYGIDYINRKAIAAPTIAEVVMWLYETHDIWIQVSDWTNQPIDREIWKRAFQWFINGEADGRPFKSPAETYEAAIKHVLLSLD